MLKRTIENAKAVRHLASETARAALDAALAEDWDKAARLVVCAYDSCTGDASERLAYEVAAYAVEALIARENGDYETACGLCHDAAAAFAELNSLPNSWGEIEV